MSRADFRGPATLTVWPHCIDAKAVEPCEVPSLLLALEQAAAALRGGEGTPWILTGAGTILPPDLLRSLMRPRGRNGAPTNHREPPPLQSPVKRI